MYSSGSLAPVTRRTRTFSPVLSSMGMARWAAPDPRRVSVIAEDDLLGKPGQELGVVPGEGGAQAGHGAVKPRLVEGDGVHVSLGEDEVALLGVLGQVQGEEVAALVVHRAVRGVEVLGGASRPAPGRQSR